LFWPAIPAIEQSNRSSLARICWRRLVAHDLVKGVNRLCAALASELAVFIRALAWALGFSVRLPCIARWKTTPPSAPASCSFNGGR
jgi:hypothetical protein